MQAASATGMAGAPVRKCLRILGPGRQGRVLPLQRADSMMAIECSLPCRSTMAGLSVANDTSTNHHEPERQT